MWIHIQLGTSMLNSIYVKRPEHSQLMTLRYLLRQLDDTLHQDGLHSPFQIIAEYYHQLLYPWGEIWRCFGIPSKNDVDFFRLLHLAAENPVVAKGFYYELANLTDAIDERDGDRASQLLTGHFSRILLLLPPASCD